MRVDIRGGVKGFVLAAALFCAGRPVVAADAPAADLYVSPAGNDAWSGRLSQASADGKDGPLASLDAARVAVRKLRTAQAPLRPTTVLLHGGVYFLDKTVTFTPEDSGSADAPIVYAAFPGETPLLSGGRPV